ncbi:hypothetical protein MYAM1_003777 [Malassezia yamatoensis]|uniref:RING-CH-type domain-containing protein n=1 Tax=Malassezia yamatoensis TaxID=253288 RepID=A0AAJ5YYH5_9BASI|nr:hypothetical protein MYAM1_003777 [Malassezia yamatoensis]
MEAAARGAKWGSDMDAIDALQVEAMLVSDIDRVDNQYGKDTPCCRICLEEGVTDKDPLRSPCECRGSMKYVHTSCLNQWRSVSQRSSSATGCDQCGTKYRFASTPLLKLLGSRYALAILTIVALFVSVVFTGMTGSALMRYLQPELFIESHPYRIQSSNLRLSMQGMPSRIQSLEYAQSSAYDTLKLRDFWDDSSGPMEVADLDDIDMDPMTYAPPILPGLFQPSVLVQLVQGMAQRCLERLCGKATLRAVPPYLLRHMAITHLGRETSDASATQSIDNTPTMTPASSEKRWQSYYRQATHASSLSLTDAQNQPSTDSYPMPRSASHTQSLLWTESFLWWLSLGFALLAITSMPNLLVVASVIAPFRFGTPFSVVGYTEYGALDTAGAEYARIIYEAINLPGVVLLAAMLWGLVSTVRQLHRALKTLVNWSLAMAPTEILDYEGNAPSSDGITVANLDEEDQDIDAFGARVRAIGSLFFWAARLVTAASRPALGVPSPVSAWIWARIGL